MAIKQSHIQKKAKQITPCTRLEVHYAMTYIKIWITSRLFGESSAQNLVSSPALLILLVWWIGCSQIGFFSPFWFFNLVVWWVSAHNLVSSPPFNSSIQLFGDSSSHIWLFGESSAHNLVSSPPFDSSDCTSPTFDDSLVAPLPVLLFWWFSLWLVDTDGSCCSSYEDNSLWLQLSIGFANSWIGLFFWINL